MDDQLTESKSDDNKADNAMGGTFVETAFSATEVNAAAIAEKNRGLNVRPCGFLGSPVKPVVGG